ncbi:hypothetical protein V8G54_037235 [Vigna mungo]|uniref:Uncharacterized protein n=1 Tax=Vigna mungo TaxID=3915 RepID=A0AAQ3RF77_VIGMU
MPNPKNCSVLQPRLPQPTSSLLPCLLNEASLADEIADDRCLFGSIPKSPANVTVIILFSFLGGCVLLQMASTKMVVSIDRTGMARCSPRVLRLRFAKKGKRCLSKRRKRRSLWWKRLREWK